MKAYLSVWIGPLLWALGSSSRRFDFTANSTAGSVLPLGTAQPTTTTPLTTDPTTQPNKPATTQQAPYANVSAIARPPSPCANPDFRPPVYVFDNIHLDKVFLWKDFDFPAHLHANLTIRDTANNYTLLCRWAVSYWSSYDDDYWFGDICELAGSNGFVGDFKSQTHLRLKTFTRPDPGPISIVQYWWCENKNGSYPLLYQAAAEYKFIPSCPATGTVDETYVCNVSTPLPVTVNAQWTLPTLPSNRLVPRPMSPPNTNASRGLDPAPSQDCTDISFTHPDWVLDDAMYVPGPKPSKPDVKTTSLNFTTASRATGARALCRWEGALRDRYFSGDKGVMMLICSPEQINSTSPFGSRDSFTAEYYPDSRELKIKHNWVCGDAQGKYSTEFSAEKTTKPPFYCTENGGSTCRANRMIVRGSLTKPVSIGAPETNFAPPANISTPGCTAGSGAPSWTVTKFWFNQTRFGRTQGNHSLTSTSPQGQILELEFTNDANQYTTHCVITDGSLSGVTDTWFRCGSGSSSAPYELETHVKFNVSEGVVYFNQTWFCSDTDPTTPLLFAGTGSFPVPLCGWTNTTVFDACGPGNGVPRPPPARCTYYYFTHWCVIGTYANGQMNFLRRSVRGNLYRQEKISSVGAMTEPDPTPGQYSCTAASLARGPVVWTFSLQDWLHGLLLRTNWPAADRVSINVAETAFVFSLNNSALPRDQQRIWAGDGGSKAMTPYLPAFEPTRTISGVGLPNNVIDTKLRFDPTSSYLELNSSWYCNDKSASSPIVFDGVWNGFLPMNCSLPPDGTKRPDNKQGTGNGIECVFSGGTSTTVTPTVTWHTTTGVPGH